MNCTPVDGDHSQAEGRAGKTRILVVDDNADAANSLGRLLTLVGNEVRVVHNGAAALSEIDGFFPHVILLDLGMPIMDGFETAEQIRARPEYRDIVLVAITGWGQDRDRQRTDAAGFAAHLIKPVNLDQLDAVLQSVVNRQICQDASPAANRRPVAG